MTYFDKILKIVGNKASTRINEKGSLIVEDGGIWAEFPIIKNESLHLGKYIKKYAKFYLTEVCDSKSLDTIKVNHGFFKNLPFHLVRRLIRLKNFNPSVRDSEFLKTSSLDKVASAIFGRKYELKDNCISLHLNHETVGYICYFYNFFMIEYNFYVDESLLNNTNSNKLIGKDLNNKIFKSKKILVNNCNFEIVDKSEIKLDNSVFLILEFAFNFKEICMNESKRIKYDFHQNPIKNFYRKAKNEILGRIFCDDPFIKVPITICFASLAFLLAYFLRLLDGSYEIFNGLCMLIFGGFFIVYISTNNYDKRRKV